MPQTKIFFLTESLEKSFQNKLKLITEFIYLKTEEEKVLEEFRNYKVVTGNFSVLFVVR